MLNFLSRILLVGLLFTGAVSNASSETFLAASGRARVQLVELFSSESCSSCPPANTWISTLQNKPGLWKKFVPIVFHVDDWNQLGWKDGFSSDKMTKRQIDLSRLWAKPSVYTPSVIVDGREWRDWDSAKNLFPTSTSQNIELSVFKNSDGSYKIKALGLDKSKHYVVHAAGLGMDISTDVKSGENAGHLLKHNFLVLDWSEKVFSTKSPEQSFSFKPTKTTRLAIAAWVEEQGRPVPLQAVGSYL